MNALAVAHPWLLAALLAALAAGEWLRRRRTRSAVPFADFGWLAALPRSPRDRLAAAWPWLRVVLLGAFALVLADPRIERRARVDVRRGVDLVVALDASSSMTAALPGSFARRRFDAARDAAREFAARRPGDRLGLLTFAMHPRWRCPPTWDHALFSAHLDETAPVAAGSKEDGTGIGVALAEAAQRLRTSSERTRVVILVTDGANNVGTIEPLEAAAFCREQGVRAYPIAVGGGEEFGSGLPPADTALLHSVAAATGGVAFVARDATALDQAWATIDALESAPLERREGVERVPLATQVLAWLAGLVALLGALEQGWLRSSP